MSISAWVSQVFRSFILLFLDHQCAYQQTANDRQCLNVIMRKVLTLMICWKETEEPLRSMQATLWKLLLSYNWPLTAIQITSRQPPVQKREMSYCFFRLSTCYYPSQEHWYKQKALPSSKFNREAWKWNLVTMHT